MSFDSGMERGRFPVVLLAPHTQSRGLWREAAAERSAAAPRVLAGIGPGALSMACQAVARGGVSCWSSLEVLRPRLPVGCAMRRL